MKNEPFCEEEVPQPPENREAHQNAHYCKEDGLLLWQIHTLKKYGSQKGKEGQKCQERSTGNKKNPNNG